MATLSVLSTVLPPPDVLAWSQPARVTAVVVLGLVLLGVAELTRQWLAAHRRRRMARIFAEANESYSAALAGLRVMAGVTTALPGKLPLSVSWRGVHLVDSYADAAASFRQLVRRIRTMSRERAQRQLAREFLKLQAYGSVFRQFQREVLRAATLQAVSGALDPPQAAPRYRAAFTVLRHELPPDLCPVLAEVLAAAVRFAVRDPDRGWRQVPVQFVNGGEAVFSRKYLERAVALRMTISRPGGEPRLFEYEISHERPVPPRRGWLRRRRSRRATQERIRE
jgi:hypothetical protein